MPGSESRLSAGFPTPDRRIPDSQNGGFRTHRQALQQRDMLPGLWGSRSSIDRREMDGGVGDRKKEAAP
jgi:hypothetical protein